MKDIETYVTEIKASNPQHPRMVWMATPQLNGRVLSGVSLNRHLIIEQSGRGDFIVSLINH